MELSAEKFRCGDDSPENILPTCGLLRNRLPREVISPASDLGRNKTSPSLTCDDFRDSVGRISVQYTGKILSPSQDCSAL